MVGILSILSLTDGVSQWSINSVYCREKAMESLERILAVDHSGQRHRDRE